MSNKRAQEMLTAAKKAGGTTINVIREHLIEALEGDDKKPTESAAAPKPATK